MEKYFVNLDSGTSFSKASVFKTPGEFHRFTYPSMFHISQGQFIGLNGSVVSQPDRFAGVVGDAAAEFNENSITRQSSFFKSDAFRQSIFYATGTGLDMLHAPENVSISLALALPSALVGMLPELRTELTASPWPIKVKNLRNVVITDVHVQAQGVSVVYDQLFGWYHGILHDDNAKKIMPLGKMISLVFGSNTTEGSQVGGDLSEAHPHTVKIGCLEIIEELSQVVADKTGEMVDSAMLSKLLKERTITLSGIEYDFSQEIKALVYEYLSQERLVNAIQSYLSNVGFSNDNRGSIFLSGGVLLHESAPLIDLLSPISALCKVTECNGHPEPFNSVLRGLENFHVLETREGR